MTLSYGRILSYGAVRKMTLQSYKSGFDGESKALIKLCPPSIYTIPALIDSRFHRLEGHFTNSAIYSMLCFL